MLYSEDFQKKEVKSLRAATPYFSPIIVYLIIQATLNKPVMSSKEANVHLSVNLP